MAGPSKPRRPDAPGTWDGLVLAIAPDRLMLGPEGSLMLAKILDRVRRADGIPLSPAYEHVRRLALSVASQAGRGHGDVPGKFAPPELIEWINTSQASVLLGVHVRTVRRYVDDGLLGRSLMQHKPRLQLLVDANEVAALAAERRNRR